MSLLRAFSITAACILLFIANAGAAFVLIHDFPQMREFASVGDALMVVLTCCLIACAVIALLGIMYVKALWVLFVIAGAKLALVMAGPFLFPDFSYLAAFFVLAELALCFAAIKLNVIDNPDPEPYSPVGEFE